MKIFNESFGNLLFRGWWIEVWIIGWLMLFKNFVLIIGCNILGVCVKGDIIEVKDLVVMSFFL